jgi:hypothetical protein
MNRIKILGLAALAGFAVSLVATTAAQAEGPAYLFCEKMPFEIKTLRYIDPECTKESPTHEGEYELRRLGAKQTHAIEGEAAKTFTLVASTDTLTCEKLHLEKGELIGSAEGTAGSSKEIILFSGCTVSGDGTGCEVEKGQIKTEEVENWLDKTNKEGVKGEHLLVGFKPASGSIFVKVKFHAPEGDKCTLSETAIEIGAKGELGVAGTALDEEGKPIELLVTSTEKLGLKGFIEFPATLLKTEFVEKEKKVEEVKESLKAFGKSVTKFEGEATVKSNEAWGVFG